MLIRPPSILGYIARENIQHPINLTMLASEALASGLEVELLDYELEIYDKARFGFRVRSSKPDLIGFSAVTPHITICAAMAEIAKKNRPQVYTAVGGPHSSVLPAETLQEFPYFDFVVIGEGEYTLVELSKTLEERGDVSSIDGIAFRQEDQVVVNKPRALIKDLNKLHLPARQLLSLSEYFKINRFKGVSSPGISRKGISTTQIFTSRGCWAKCIFCPNDAVFGNKKLGRKIRFRSYESIAEEILQCIKDFGINHFSIEDEVFPVNKKLLHQLCYLFRRNNVTWNCNARVDILNKDDLELMAKHGCLKLELGVESGSPRILSKIKKKINLDQVEQVFSWAKDAGILRTAYLMLGSHPEETEEDIYLTKKLVQRIKPDLITFTIAVPYPGTELYQILKKHGLLKASNWEFFQYYNRIPPWRTFNMTAEELVKRQTEFLRWFYMRPTYMLQKLFEINSPQQFLYFLSAGFNTFKYLLLDRKKQIDRRSEPRLRTKLLKGILRQVPPPKGITAVFTENLGTEYGPFTIIDISSSGLQLKVPEDDLLRIKMEYKLDLNGDGLDFGQELTARMVRQTRGKAGFRFIKINRTQKRGLKKLLKDIAHESKREKTLQP